MRITDTSTSSALLAQIQQLSAQQAQLQAEEGSGIAVAAPSDNPAVYGQAVELESQTQAATQFQANASQALEVANASYSGLQSLQSIYDRASQLGAQGNGVNGLSAQQAYASEVDQLIQQAVQVGNTKLGNNYLYAGTAENAAPVTTTSSGGQITAATYAGNATQTTIPISSTSSVAPGTTGATNTGIVTFINSLISLRDALNAGDETAISAANQSVTSAEDVITGAVGENGAAQARIQAEQTAQQANATQLGKMMSDATSADLPSTIDKLNRAQLAYQAALQSSASIMHVSILNYLVLQ